MRPSHQAAWNRKSPNASARRRDSGTSNGSLQYSSLEPRALLAGVPIISEFVASNNSSFDDGYGNSPDWIELHNAGDMAVDLSGYHLTDNASNVDKWTFESSTVLDPGEFLVVFASSRDEIDPSGFRHTNFKLSAGGEYVGLASPDGTILSEFGTAGADYPAQVSDISYGTSGGSLVTGQSLAQYLIPTNGVLGNAWVANDFDASANGFITDRASFGYENSLGSSTSYVDQYETDIPTDTTSIYVRTEFDLADASAVADLTLSLQYDDGFAAYLNGTFLFSRNADDGLAWNASASASHDDSDALQVTPFKLDGSASSEGDFLDLLVDGKNTLAIHGLNRPSSSDFLLVPTLTSNSLPGSAGYLLTPTPGGANAEPIILGPAIENVTPSGITANANQPLTITASVSDFSRPVDSSTVRLHYRSMFDNEIIIVMNDNGLGADSTAGDGIYSASIPASALSAGELIRWYVTASDIDGNETRAPRFLDPLDSAEYFGTVVTDSAIVTDLPLLQWFVADEGAARTQTGTRGSLFYNGEFYDNIQFDGHGQSTSFFDKTSFDFDANSGEKFLLLDGVNRASDFNLITNYADQTKIRNALAYGLIAEAGLPSHLAFSVTVYRNGNFYGLYDIIEEGDEEFLERTGLDPNGALYKVNNPLNSAFNEVEKKSREYEDHSDFQEVINAVNLSGATARRWDYDNLDIADAINFLAVQNVIQNKDYGHKNMYWYHDNDGTGLWSPLAWDVDLSLGHLWNGNPSIQYFDNNSYTNDNPSQELNNLFQRLVSDPIHRELYYRRVRTLMDQFYGAPGTLTSESLVAQRIDELSLSIIDEAAQDASLWDLHPNYASAYPFNVPQALDQLKDDFVSGRRSYLEAFSLIPNSQIGNPEIRFDDTDFDSSPISGLQSEEYLRLNNPLSTSVDISGWTLTGGINHVFKGGTVIPAGGELFVVADVQAFKARSVGPQGGQQRIIQGNYDGQLSNTGETVNLLAADGSIIDTFVTPLDGPSDNQQFLRVSELNYHPTDTAGDTEYIEFLNTSSGLTSTTLNLSGVTISEGPGDPFVFDNGVTLAAGERLLVVSDVSAFNANYPSVNFTQIVGQYSGSLSDGGETIRVDDANGETILEFDYNDSDPWALAADGAGGSLQVVDELNTPLDRFGKYYSWRSSVNAGGTPGEGPIDVTPTVVVNEVLAHTDAPNVDFVELFNPTNSSINVGGWYLSDSATQLQKYQIPANTIIAAGGYLLVDENNFNPTPTNPGANDFALSSSGEEVWLTQFAGGETTFQDVVSLGATFNGESFGRIPNGSGRLTALASLTPNEANSSARIGPLLITEINYHPDDPTSEDLAIEATLTASDLEFIEVYNPTSSPIDLANWQLRGESDFDFSIGSIAGQTAFLITRFDPTDPNNADRTAAFRNHYGLSDGVALLGGYSGSLSNSWGRVELQQPDPTSLNDPEIAHVTADEFVYDDLSPWPDADGNGLTLQRIAANVVGHLPSNWNALVPTPGVASLVQAVPQIASLVRDGGNEDRPDSIETLSITFDTDVNVSVGDLSLRNDTLGGTVIDTTGLLFNYDSSSQTATWDLGDLATPLEAAYYSVILSDSITAVSGGLALDGDEDGTAGGNFEQSVYVALPGDANLDGQVDVLNDAFILVANLGQTDAAVWSQGDFNDDGAVNVLGDAFVLVANLGRSVVSPTSATSKTFPLAAISTQPDDPDSSLSRDMAFANDNFWFE